MRPDILNEVVVYVLPSLVRTVADDDAAAAAARENPPLFENSLCCVKSLFDISTRFISGTVPYIDLQDLFEGIRREHRTMLKPDM